MTRYYWRALITAGVMSLGAPASLPAFAQGISVEGVVDCGSWIKTRSSKVCIGKACTGVGGGHVMLLRTICRER